MAKETIYYQEDDVLVSNVRMVIGTEVIVMRSVTSVEGTRIQLDYAVPGALVIIGGFIFLFLFLGDARIWSIGGIIMAVAGIALAIFRKRPYAAVISTTSGETIRYRSDDRDDITKIIAALNEAIIAQGDDADDGDESSEGDQGVADGEDAVDGREGQGEQGKAN